MNRINLLTTKRSQQILSFCLFLVLVVPVLGQEKTAAKNDLPAFETFKVIFERNIFDPNRRPQRTMVQVERKPDPVVDEISLIGTLVTDQQTYAFFESNRSAYRGVLETGASIADYQIDSISSHGVILSASNTTLKLDVGMGLSRKDQGSWQIIDSPGTYNSSSTLARRDEGAPSSTSTEKTQQPTESSNSDLLKKLMERRRQELSQ